MTNSIQSCPVCHTAIAPGTSICPNCGLMFTSSGVAPVEGPPQIAPPPAPGQLIGGGRYTLGHVLSKGGMGAIYLAADHAAFDRSVVVKVMLDYFDPTRPDAVREARARFLDEARTLAALRHPAIPQIYTYFQDGPHNYIVMEYIEGADLDQALSATDPASGATHAGAAYAYEQVLGWGVEVCQVLEYLSSRQPPVVHHDIKPDNLLRDSNSGELRLVDFGTAKARLLVQPGGRVGVQKSDAYGTKGYAAPEQYRGESEPRSDVYALAATLYHLATDDDPTLHPFDFPKLDSLGALGRVLRAALATEPAQRPTATELRQQLEELVLPTELHPLEAPDSTRITSAYELASWCEAHWDAGVKWLRGKLPDQIELLWGKSALAARTRGALERFGAAGQAVASPAAQGLSQDKGDGDAALDALLRLLVPGFPPPQLTLTPPALDFGAVGLARPAQRPLTIRNSGRGYVLVSLPASGWLTAEPSTLRLRPGQSASVQVRAAPQTGAPGMLNAALAIASQHGALTSLQASARLIFQTPDGHELRDVGELVAWCQAHWFDAGLWLTGVGPSSLPAQIEQLWGNAALASALRTAVGSYGVRDRQLDAALELMDPQGYGAHAPQLVITPDTVDFGRLAGVAQVQLQVANAGQRFAHVPVVYPPWIAGSPQAIDLQPGDVRQLALNVYPNQIGLREPLDGAIELRQTAAPVDVPVRARAPLVRRIWWRYPTQATLALLALAVLLFVVITSIATARARQQDYEAGVAALERGDWTIARLAFDALLDEDPNYRDAAALRDETFYRPGEQALAQGDWERARRELRHIPRYRDANTLLRESYYRPALTAVREEQWEPAAEQIVRLEALDVRYRDLPTLLTRPELNAAVQRRRWQGGDVARLVDLNASYFALSDDGRFIATADNTTVQVWSSDIAALPRSFTVTDESSIFSLNAVALSPDGALVAAGGAFGSSLWLWNVADGRRIELDLAGATYIAHVSSLRFSPDGRLLISGDSGATRLWRTRDGALLDPLGDGRIFTSVAFSPTGDTLGLVYSDTVTLWRASDETTLRTIATGHGEARVAAFSTNGETLAVLSGDGTAGLWRTSDGAPLGTLAGSGAGSGLLFAPDGQTLATIAESTVRLWRASDMGLIKELDGIDVMFAPDGKTLAVTSHEGVTLYQSEDGAQRATLADDVDYFDPARTSVAYSPDGQTIALLGPGLRLQLWRADDGTPLQTLPAGWDEGTLAFSPDGRTLISASQSEPVRLWSAQPSGE